MLDLRGRSALIFVLAVSACGPSGPEPAPQGTPVAAAPAEVGAPAKPEDPQRTLKKGESAATPIAAGETHEWGIDLTAEEKVVVSIAASSTGAEMCSAWGVGLYDPRGEALVEVPAGAEDSGHWDFVLEQVAEIAGRHRVRITLGAACQELTYSVKAR